MFIYLNKKAQSTAEYVIVLGLIVAAVVAMQTYVKRGLQGKMKDATDYNDPSARGVFTTKQYEPGYVQSSFQDVRSSDETASGSLGDAAETQRKDTTKRTGTHEILGTQTEESGQGQ